MERLWNIRWNLKAVSITCVCRGRTLFPVFTLRLSSRGSCVMNTQTSIDGQSYNAREWDSLTFSRGLLFGEFRCIHIVAPSLNTKDISLVESYSYLSNRILVEKHHRTLFSLDVVLKYSGYDMITYMVHVHVMTYDQLHGSYARSAKHFRTLQDNFQDDISLHYH